MKFKNSIILLFVVLFAGFIHPQASFAKWKGSAPYDGLLADTCSGASGDTYTSCSDTSCHKTVGSTGSVVVTVKNSGGTAVTSYTGGASYTVYVAISHTGLSRWGFQTKVSAGTPTADSTKYTELALGKSNYIQSTGSINNTAGAYEGTANTATYSFAWTAPSAGTGTVTLNTAALAANGDSAEGTGDYGYTATTSLTEGSGTTKTLSSISATASSSTLTSAGATSTITTTATYSDSTTATVTGTLSSSNTAVATVSGSTVTAVANGTTTITSSYTEGGVTKTATVTITVSITAAKTLSSISATASSSTLTSAGATSTITTTATYSDSSTGTVTPTSTTSSDTAVATVSGSTITAVASGTTTITVSYTEGGVTKTATVSITVSIAAQPPTVTSFTPTSGVWGDTITITGTNFISGATVKFGSKDACSGSATVSNSTTITAKPCGGETGKITVTTAGGSGSSTSNFTYTLSGLEIPTVPTLGEWGNILLALVLLSAAGYFSLRKKKGLGC